MSKTSLSGNSVAQADLHVHSCYSKNPGEWILQRLGTRESYTSTEAIYQQAKVKGNAFVTLTDHNTIEGALELCRNHPDDCFVSTESTAYFPEDGCKIHILCYDITEEQFEVIQLARENIYNLRDYLKSENIACSVAHATFSINNRLKLEHLEKLILLFDVFEGINGTRGKEGNQVWNHLLENLTPDDIERLKEKHHLETWSDTPWKKGITGGSDDHAGLYMGYTYTISEASDKTEFIDNIRNRQSTAGGRHGNFKALAYAIFKIASEHVRQKQSNVQGLAGLLSNILFQKSGPGLKEKIFIKKLGLRKSKRDQLMAGFLTKLNDITQDGRAYGPDWQIDKAYNALAELMDDFSAEIGSNIEKGFRGQETQDILQYISSTLPIIIFATPFISTLRLLSKSRHLNEQLIESFRLRPQGTPKKVIWFSDTIADLNGVSITMNEIAQQAKKQGAPLQIAGCLASHEESHPIADRILKLPRIYEVTPEFYDAHTARFPSLMRSLDIIAAQRPDKIVISTPGPVGLTAWLASRLLGIPCTGVYHTDFAKQFEDIVNDKSVVDLIQRYTNWFYNHMDEIRVPSSYYITQLADQGVDRSCMKLFKRGLDKGFLHINDELISSARRKWSKEDKPTLLYSGRLGKEKNLYLLVNIYNRLKARKIDLRLIFAGDGPEKAMLEEMSKNESDIIFTGRLEREELKAVYHISDLFVFPSDTDTFGMSVLEAQSLGLPAIVSKKGGPKEVIKDGVTGYAHSSEDINSWVESCEALINAKLNNPDAYNDWCKEIKNSFKNNYSWKNLVNSFTEVSGKSEHVFNAGKPEHKLSPQPNIEHSI